MFSGGNNNVLCPPDDVVSCMGPSNDINITRILVLSYICSMNCPRDLSSATLYNNHPFLGRRPPLHLLLLHTFTSQPAECRTFLICRREEEGQSMEWQRKHSKVSGQEVFCHQDGTLAGGRGRQFAYSHFINALSYWFHFELYVVWRDTQSASHWSMWHSLGQRMSQQLEPAILNSDPTSLIGKQSEAVN